MKVVGVGGKNTIAVAGFFDMFDPVAVQGLTATLLPVPTSTGLPVVRGFTVNSKIHPRGMPCAWHVEYGATSSYGTSTASRALPARLEAYFEEDWSWAADGRGPWVAEFGNGGLFYSATGGPSGGPYVYFTDAGPTSNDPNHTSGIGYIHLPLAGYLCKYLPGSGPPAGSRVLLGGGFTDFRGAKFRATVRGNSWVANSTTIGSWIQAERDWTVHQDIFDARRPNWAHTANPRTAAFTAGTWNTVEWQFHCNSNDWTFAGTSPSRGVFYDYGELDSALGHVNLNIFPFQILNVNAGGGGNYPSGAMNYSNISITYRNHNVCKESNGGTLTSFPPGGSGEQYLTDGWRNGVGREWVSGDSPSNQTFVYSFASPIVLWTVVIGNSVQFPSENVMVQCSVDGSSWTTLGTVTLARESPHGPNMLYGVIEDHSDGTHKYIPLNGGVAVNYLRVRILSGHTARWGLGEIEAFGDGAVEKTDNEWYNVSQDVVVPAGTYHYRPVAVTALGTVYGADQTVTVV